MSVLRYCLKSLDEHSTDKHTSSNHVSCIDVRTRKQHHSCKFKCSQRRPYDDAGYVQGLARVRPTLYRAFRVPCGVHGPPSKLTGLHMLELMYNSLGRDVGLQRHRGNCLVHNICVYMINATIANVFSSASYASPLICSIACFLEFGLLFHGCEHISAHNCQLPRLPACLPAAP